jgi:hypothetical protein
LGDSLAAMGIHEAAGRDITYDYIKITWYCNGAHWRQIYGIQMVDSANKESSADFYKVLNDDVFN